jgi:hypothetical protein
VAVAPRRRALAALAAGVVATHTGSGDAGAAVVGRRPRRGAGACLSGDAALAASAWRRATLQRAARRRAGGPGRRPRVLHAGATPVRVVPASERLGDLRHPARGRRPSGSPAAVLHAAAWAPSDRAAEWRVAAAVQQRRRRPRTCGSARGMPRLRRPPSSPPCSTTWSWAPRGQRARLPALPAALALPRRTAAAPVRLGRAALPRRLVGAAARRGRARRRPPPDVAAWEDDLLRANDVVVAGRPRARCCCASPPATCGTTRPGGGAAQRRAARTLSRHREIHSTPVLWISRERRYSVGGGPQTNLGSGL